MPATVAKQPKNMKKTLTMLGQGPLSSTPIFSLDGKFVIFSTKTGIKVYSSKTGLLVHSIESYSKKPDIILDIHSAHQIYANYGDLVELYDFKFGILISQFKPNTFFESFTCHPTDSSCLIVVSKKTFCPKLGNDRVDCDIIQEFNIRKNTFQGRYCHAEFGQFIHHLITKDCKAVIVTRQSPNQFYVIDLKTTKVIQIMKFQHAISCLALSPNGNDLALGDAIGCIHLCHSYETKQIATRMHWHAHKVSCLEFTADGVYLLSGGVEATLVLWQLATGHRQFVPRLGAEIINIAISKDQLVYAVGLQNNSLLLMSATDLKVKKTIAGLKAAGVPLDRYPMSVGLEKDPKTGSLVLNGSPSQLQFISPENCETRFELDLAIRNRVTFGKEIALQPHISHAKFSKSGNWLVTVDEREAPEFPHESFLKFWTFDPKSQTYAISTRVDSPHSAKITSLAYSPTADICVTTSADKSWKMWKLIDDSRWACTLVSSFQSLPAQKATFSQDGSILAIAFGSLVTLWNASNGNLVRTLNLPIGDTVYDILFLSDTPYLVVKGKATMHLYSLLSCSVVWSLKISVAHLAAGPKGKFCCATDEGVIHVFASSSPCPVETINLSRKSFGLAVLDNGAIAYLDKEFILTRIDSVEAPAQTAAVTSKPKQSIFGSVYGGQTEKVNVKKVQNLQDSRNIKTSLFQSSSHIIPTPSKLNKTFLESMLEGAVVH